MKLFELFDTPQEYRWVVKDGRDGSLAEFKVGEQKYTVFIEVGPDSINTKGRFDYDPDDPEETREWQENQHPYIISFAAGPDDENKHSFSQTKDNSNPIAVFSSVLKIVQDYMGEKNPHPISFTSLDSRLDSIYNQMIKRFAKGWNAVEDSKGYVTVIPPGYSIDPLL